MQIHNYFYFNGVPYDQLSFNIQKNIDLLIQRIKLDHLYERIALYQDHFFNIIQDNNKRQKQFESDLPEDITEDIIKAYLKAERETSVLN